MLHIFKSLTLIVISPSVEEAAVSIFEIIVPPQNWLENVSTKSMVIKEYNFCIYNIYMYIVFLDTLFTPFF